MRFPLHSSLLAAAVLALAACSSPAGEASVAPRGASARAPQPESSARSDGPKVIVTGPDGAALAGAEVWFVDPRKVDPELAVIASRTLGEWVEASRAMATSRATTGERGLAALGGRHDGGFLVAARQGALFGVVERVTPLPASERIALQLLSRASYPVLVREATGAPARGVALTLAAPDPGAPDTTFPLPSSAVTDERGFATLYEPPPIASKVYEGLDQVPERVALIRVPAAGLVPAPLDLGGERVSVDLPPLRPIEIRCRHAAFSEDHWGGLVQVFLASDGSRSDRTLAHAFDGGRLGLPHASPTGELRLVAVVSEADAPGRFIGTLTVDSPAPSSEGAGAGGSAEAGAPRIIELPLDAGLILTGRCVDAAGAALANETIDLFVVGDVSTSWTEVTDREGRFRWLLMRPGKPLARVVIGARTRTSGTQFKTTKRLGDVSAGEVVDVGVLTLR